MVTAGTTNHIQFGDGLTVTDEGGGVIRVDGGGGAGGGIDFDTSPQTGDWLYVETTDSTGSPNGWGIELNDQSSDGIWIHADTYNLLLGAGHNATLGAGGTASVNGNAGVTLTGAPLHISLSADNKIDWIIGTGLTLNANVDMSIQIDGDGFQVIATEQIQLLTSGLIQLYTYPSAGEVQIVTG